MLATLLPRPSTHTSQSLSLFFSTYGAHRDLHSFPTRRSSDLTKATITTAAAACALTVLGATARAANTTTTTITGGDTRSEEHTSELQSQSNLVCRLLLEKKKTKT